MARIDKDDFLNALDTVIRNRSAIFKGNIFTAVHHLTFMLRAFEFGSTNGALDYTGNFLPGSSYSARY